MEEKKIDERIEQATLDGYADQENNPATDKEKVEYLRARYEAVKAEYKTLQLQKWEADGSKNEPISRNCAEALSRNYRHRKFIVRALRAAGETVEDRFIVG